LDKVFPSIFPNILGFFAVVYKGYNKHTNQVVCLKQIVQQQDGESALHEAKVLASLNHPNIVKYLGVIQQNGNNFIVTEFLDKGDLLTFVQTHASELQHEDFLDM
jgi:serine/threonine protein kinase